MENKTKARELGITKFPYREYNNRGNLLYIENENGYWEKRKYNGDNKMIQYEEGRDNELWNEWGEEYLLLIYTVLCIYY